MAATASNISDDFTFVTKPTLFHYTNWCSTRPLQLIYELGLEDAIDVRWLKEKKILTSTAYMKEIHAFGKVPAFKDGDFRLMESGAIFLYILDKYSNRVPSELLPANLKPLLYQYLFLACTSLYDFILSAFWNESDTSNVTKIWRENIMPYLESRIVDGGFLESPVFTVLDVAMTYELVQLEGFKLIDEGSKLGQYVQRVKQRATFARTFA
ncbi:hypothetical protein BJ742DRAFT_804910 [Cladochytrium replicatum]|nr:hypothetical protein BJ742DRAFT_804910 [Cladochytrium replicatum]